MRITLINQFYTPDISPTAHLSASLAQGLARDGHHVTVVTSRGGYVDASRSDRAHSPTDNPRIYRVWTPRLGKKTILKRCLDYAAFYLSAAWRVIALPRQDVIISLTTPPYIAWTAVFHRWLHRGTKIVLWNMDCYPDAAELAGVIKNGGLLSKLLRAVNRALFRRLDHLICLDNAMVHLLLSQYAPKSRTLPTTIIPNWENAAFFPQPGPPTAADAPPLWPEAAALGLSGKFVVLYLGNTGVGHPFETVIDAARQLQDKPVLFLFVGGGKRWPWLQNAKEQHQLDNLLLHPYVQKELTASVMASAHCALITLADEMAGVMSPSKLHSNLAMALPILYVGPKTSNVDDAIERFSCGLSVRQNDADALVRFITDALATPDHLTTLRLNARRAFDSAYCDTQTLPQFEQLLTSLFPPPTPAHHPLPT